MRAISAIFPQNPLFPRLSTHLLGRSTDPVHSEGERIAHPPAVGGPTSILNVNESSARIVYAFRGPDFSSASELIEKPTLAE